MTTNPNQNRDDPASLDGFDGGGHKRTAKALARAIKALDGRDGAIGVDGPWGSGKSTLIKLAQSELQGDDAAQGPSCFAFFIFDMWSHQTSVFRQAYLDTLIAWGETQIEGASEAARKLAIQKARVRGTQIETTNQSQWHLDWFGLGVIGILSPFTVVWLIWLGNMVSRWSQGFSSDTANVHWHESLGLIWLPIVLGIYFLRAWWTLPAAEDVETAEGSRPRWRIAFSNALRLFVKKQQAETLTQNIQQIDPTGYEFEETCREIIAILQGTGLRLVLVFDNIDRLPYQDIPAAWAHMRSVFVGDVNNPYMADKSCTALVPYDKARVREAFDHRSIEAAITQKYAKDRAAQTPGWIETYTTPQDQDEEPFSKSFNQVFQVPIPVLSDISGFICAYAAEQAKNLDTSNPALALNEDDFKRLNNVFQLTRLETNTKSTPREIKRFVEACLETFDLWEGQFNLDCVAIFQHLKAEGIENWAEALTQYRLQTYVPMVQASIDDLQESLAAMALNLEPDKALEVLLSNQISSILNQEKIDQILSLQSTKGFEEALKIRISSIPIREDRNGSFIGLLLTTLEKLDPLSPAVDSFIRKHLDAVVCEMRFPERPYKPEEFAMLGQLMAFTPKRGQKKRAISLCKSVLNASMGSNNLDNHVSTSTAKCINAIILAGNDRPIQAWQEVIDSLQDYLYPEDKTTFGIHSPWLRRYFTENPQL